MAVTQKCDFCQGIVDEQFIEICQTCFGRLVSMTKKVDIEMPEFDKLDCILCPNLVGGECMRGNHDKLIKMETAFNYLVEANKLLIKEVNMLADMVDPAIGVDSRNVLLRIKEAL